MTLRALRVPSMWKSGSSHFWLISLAITCHLGGFCTSAHGRALSVDDVLNVENVGIIEISPDGKHVLFERHPAPASRTAFGLSSAKYEGRVYLYDVEDKRPAQPLPSEENVDGEWLGPMSPSGGKVVVYRRRASQTELAFFDTREKRVMSCAFRPAIDFGLSDPVWLSDREIVHSRIKGNDGPVAVDFLQQSARKLATQWELTWAGRAPAVSALRTPGHSAGFPQTTAELYRLNAETCDAELVADGNFAALTVSSTGDYIVGARREGLLPQSPVLSRAAQEGPFSYVPYVVNIRDRGAALRLCSECDVEPSSIQWSSDGRSLIYFSRKPEHDWDRGGRFTRYEISSGRSTTFDHQGLDLVSQREHGHIAVPELAVPLGSGIAVAARALDDKRAPGRFTDRPFASSDEQRLDWYLLVSGQPPRNLTAALSNVSSAAVAARHDSFLLVASGALFRVDTSDAVKISPVTGLSPVLDLHDNTVDFRALSNEPAVLRRTLRGHQSAIAFGERGNALEPISPPKGDWQLMAIARVGTTAVFKGTNPGPSLAIGRAKQRRMVPFWTFNQHLSGIEPAREVYVSHLSNNGAQAHSCVLLPSGVKDPRTAPVIVHIYPGSGRCWRLYRSGVSYAYEPELFTAMGYVVVFPFAPPEELRTTQGPLGGWARSTELALDAVAKAQLGDTKRVGAFGVSYGAASTLALLTQSATFGAAIVSHGAANFTSHYGALGVARRLLPDDLFAVGQSLQYESRGSFLWVGSAPWDAASQFMSASPYFSIDKIQTPVMLMHSDLDWDYQMDQFDQVFVALYRLGRDAEYVRYWGEGHGLSSPANIRDMWGRMERWYGTHLRADPSRELAGQGLERGFEAPAQPAKVRALLP